MHLKKIFLCLSRRRPDERRPSVTSKGQKEVESEGGYVVAEEQGSQWLQFTAAISACLALMACGGHLSWTSPALPYLKSPDSSFPVTTGQGSWIVSLYTLGSLFGSLLSPLCVDRLGRKAALLAFALPQLAGWGLIIGARSVVILYVARFVAGIGHGGIYNAGVIYLGEIADKNIRGALGTFLKMSSNVGSLFTTTLGAYLPYWELNVVSLSIPLIFVLTFTFMPETPYFYLIRGRDEDAEKSLMQLRRLRKPESVKEDMMTMKDAVEEGKRSKKNALLELLRTRGNRRSLLILLGLKATQQFSGHMAIVAYTQEIFSHGGTSLSPAKAVVVLGIAQLIAGIVAASLIDRVGRRILMLISGLSSAVALLAVGLFFYLKYYVKADVSAFSWIPVAAIIAYEVMTALGIGTLPYVLLGELFPTNVKAPAVASGMIVGSFFAFVVGLGFEGLNSVVGIHWTFWIFAISCAIGTLFVYFITPETKGKSLEEIQRQLNPSKGETEGRDP